MPNASSGDFLNPSKKCDIVMKGGITSGVVYPNTVSLLAQTYRLVNIGGTSAGAIAAAATAAAEYRRQQGSGEGFEKLSRLPTFLGEKPKGSSHTNLFYLFQPDPAARMLFDLGVSLTHKGIRRVGSLFVALFKGAWLVWLGVAAIAALYFWLPLAAPLRQSLFDRISATVWLVGFVVLGLVVVLVRSASMLPPKGFGFCSGMTPKGSANPALSDWFHGFLNDIAGKPLDQPLTFGDLNSKGIQLRMISTCLTHRRPYGLPIDSQQFYFKSKELEEYFPEPVVKWMEAHPYPRDKGRSMWMRQGSAGCLNRARCQLL